MRNLLALFAFALITFAVVGWTLDWYRVQTIRIDQGHHEVHICIDDGKISSDLQKGSEKLQDTFEKGNR